MRWTHSNILKMFLSLGFILFIIIWISKNTMLLVAQSNSLPYHYFLLIKDVSIKKGDLIAIQHHPLSDIPNVILTKRLVGVPNDTITLKGQIMQINKEWQGLLQKKNSKGLPLTPLRVSFIPRGFVFVVGSHAGSLDSRYAEFGLVEERHILGKVYGLW